MKKHITGILIGLITGIAGHFAYNYFFDYEPISPNLASVTIKNESGKEIKNIFLRKNHATIEATGVNNNGEIRFIFTNGTSENSYNVIATFDNDSTVKSQPVYFEYGYRGTETITPSGIKTENNW